MNIRGSIRSISPNPEVRVVDTAAECMEKKKKRIARYMGIELINIVFRSGRINKCIHIC